MEIQEYGDTTELDVNRELVGADVFFEIKLLFFNYREYMYNFSRVQWLGHIIVQTNNWWQKITMLQTRTDVACWL